MTLRTTIPSGRNEAGALATAQIGVGVLMLTSSKLKIPGTILLSGGIAGGYYVYRQSGESFEWSGYRAQTVQGAISGMVAGAFGQMVQGAGTVAKMFTQVVGGFFGAGTAAASVQLMEKGNIQDRQVVFQKALTGGIGAIASTITGEGLNLFAPESGALPTVAFQTFKGSATSVMSKMATNWQEGEDVLNDVFASALMGGGVSGLIATVEQIQDFDELSKAYLQKQKANQELQKAQVEKALHEKTLSELQTSVQTQKEQMIAAAKKNVEVATEQLAAAEKISQQMQQSYEYSAARVDQEIKSHLNRGFQAKVKGQFTKTAAVIREALLNGEKVEWWPKDLTQPRELVCKNPFRLHHESAELRVQQAKLRIKAFEAVVAYNPIDLKMAQGQLTQKEALFSDVQLGGLSQVFGTLPVTFVDCDMNELIPHIVLVHGVCQDTLDRYPDSYSIDLNDQDCMARFLLQRIFTPDGTFAHHLEMEKREFSEQFVERPQTHWAWNQLVHPNSGALDKNGWEGARIAVLEPLSALENSHVNQPFAVTPYDTQVFGSIRLSEKSTILVPAHLVTEVQARLTGFRGQIVGYNPTQQLRTAVMDTLCAHYPETWHICNSQGEVLGRQAHYTIPGYETKTCVKTKQGEVHILLHREGKDVKDQPSQAMRDYHSKAKRYIGLHVGAKTYWLENEPYFKLLKEVLKNKEIVKNNAWFAGDVKNIASLGVLKAFDFYCQLIQVSVPQTGCQAVAIYALKEAIGADIVSLFFQMYPDKSFELSSLDLQMIVSPLLPACKKLFKQMRQVDAQKLFTQYCLLLKESLTHIQQAQQEAIQSLAQNPLGIPESSQGGKIDFTQAQKEWDQVTMPETVEFDLGKSWPLTPQLHAYVSQVFHLLSKDREALLAIYHQLVDFRQESMEKKECYRINVLRSVLQWAIQEQIYLNLRKKNFTSTLAILFAKHEQWLWDHHLEVRDFTKNIGDCLFDNVIAQAPDISSKTAPALRKELVQFMNDHAVEYQSKPDYQGDNFLEVAEGSEALTFRDWKSYLECLSKPQVWATELEIQALSFLLERPIVLISVDAVLKIYNLQSTKSPIFLNHKNWNHYESCQPLAPHTSHEVYQRVTQEPHY